MTGKGQTALVTGASSGIGKETAIRLSKKGFEVIVAARRMDRLEDLAKYYPGIIPRQVDLSNPEDVQDFYEYIKALSKPVSVLINNAGYSIRGALEDIRLEDVRRMFEVNYYALIRITQACLPGMRRQRKGTIVNLSSIVGKYTFPMSGVYASSKHAVEAVTDALRMEVRPYGIRVVTIRPGPIATEFNDVGNEMTGDLMARTDPEYKPLYEASGGAVGKLFAGITLPGPDIIADLILEAVTSEAPKPVYTAGPMVKEFLEPRLKMDDETFDRYLSEKTGLWGIRV
jgi:NADP-dependent 3-hydroxy acid dehydrogenase YdfG